DIHLDAAVHNPHRIRAHRENRRKRANLAGQEVESRAVARALDQAVVELPLPQHAAIVGADVVDRAPGAVVAVSETEALRPRMHDFHLAGRDLVLARDGDEFAQGRTPISAMLPMRGRTAFRTRWRTCSSFSSLITRR